MFYITKADEPEELTIFKNNLIAKRIKIFDWAMCPPQVKEIIRFNLAIEQNELCAYCTRKIDEYCNIEHFHTRHSYPNEMFDYVNMLGVDNKNQLSPQFKNKCEDGRGSQLLRINPLDINMVNGIYYLPNGEIRHNLYQSDLNDILKLNDDVFRLARLNVFKKMKSNISIANNYDYWIDIYEKLPFGCMAVYYLTKKKTDPDFVL